ncbi:MAG: ABC transporter ATP-binding protein [Desulfatibacillaceae bacterium]
MNIVEAKGVEKVYQQGKVEVRALQGIDLSVEKGGFVALAGPSGSGKTTMLNIIGGLDSMDKGTVTVENNRLETMSQSGLAELRLNRIGFVFQAYNLIPVLSAEENVEFVMLLQGVSRTERREKTHAILEDVGLGGMFKRRPSELSGGQQQRVAVARAIVSDPAIVLADEPTANLDSRTGNSLLEMMREMNEKRGATFIFSTHDNMVMEYARRLVRMQDGRIVGEEDH